MKNGRKFSKQVENTVGKGGIACTQQFSFPTVFSEGLHMYSRHVKPSVCLERVKNVCWIYILCNIFFTMISAVCIHKSFPRIFFVFFIKICKFKCSTTSDWLSCMLLQIRGCVTCKCSNKKAMMALELLTWAFWIVWNSIKEQRFKSQPLGYKHRIFYDLT